MPGVMDIIVRATDQATAVLDQVGEAGERAGSLIDQHWVGATAALTAAGGAIEAATRRQQAMTVSTRQLAARLGENEDTVRGWASSISNAGFPLGEVVELMDLGSRRGLEGGAVLQDYANFWDMVGDATGESAVALGAAGVGLQGIGIAAGEEGEALDALGFVMDNTTAGVGEFLNFVSRTGPQLREMGVDVNDTAAIMGVLENELGLTGRVARTQFNQAVSESDGTLQGMLATLGISEEQFATWREQVEGAGAAVERNAQIADDAITPFQNLQNELGDLAYSFAPVVEGAADLAPLMIAVGPAAKVAQIAMSNLARVGPILATAMRSPLAALGALTGVLLGGAAAGQQYQDVIGGLAHQVLVELGAQSERTADQVNADIERVALALGTDIPTAQERMIEAVREADGDWSAAMRSMGLSAEAMSDEQRAAAEQAQAAWVAFQGGTAVVIDETGRIVEEGVDSMAEELGLLPEKGADELLANQQRLADATNELVEFMEAALSPTEEIFRLEGFLASGELAAGLADQSPLVRQKAAELRDEAIARLAEIRNLAYLSGSSGGYAFGSGLQDPAVIAFVRGSASRVAAAARGIFPSSEPTDPTSPLRGITTAWGFMDVLAEGLEHDADRPARAMARAMGLVRDEVTTGDPISASIGIDAGSGALGVSSGASEAGGVHYHDHFTVTVAGVRRPVESIAELVKVLTDLELFADGSVMDS